MRVLGVVTSMKFEIKISSSPPRVRVLQEIHVHFFPFYQPKIKKGKQDLFNLRPYGYVVDYAFKEF